MRTTGSLAASFGKTCINTFKHIAAEFSLHQCYRFFDRRSCKNVCGKDIGIAVHKEYGRVKEVEEFLEIKAIFGKNPLETGFTNTMVCPSFGGGLFTDNRIAECADGLHAWSEN